MVLFPPARKIHTKLLPREHCKRGQKQACPQVLVTVEKGAQAGKLGIGQALLFFPRETAKATPQSRCPFSGILGDVIVAKGQLFCASSTAV